MLKSDFVIPYLDEINKLLGKEWTLRVLFELRRFYVIRYNDLLESLEGISTSTLSITLKNLQKEGLVSRRSVGKNPPFKVEYSLTKKGFSFMMAFYPLLKWAAQKQQHEMKISS